MHFTLCCLRFAVLVKQGRGIVQLYCCLHLNGSLLWDYAACDPLSVLRDPTPTLWLIHRLSHSFTVVAVITISFIFLGCNTLFIAFKYTQWLCRETKDDPYTHPHICAIVCVSSYWLSVLSKENEKSQSGVKVRVDFVSFVHFQTPFKNFSQHTVTVTIETISPWCYDARIFYPELYCWQKPNAY